MGLGPRHQTLAELSGPVLAPDLSGMPTLCSPVVCSLPAQGGVTIISLSEIRLDYSPFHAGFAYKTTEQL